MPRASSDVMRPALRVLSLLAFLFAEAALAGAASGDAVYARAGDRIAIGDMHLNAYCLGSGSPTVVFDSGYGDWSPAWAVLQPQVAKYTRACAFDRAGYGFSDAGPMPRSSARIADELHAALHAASIPGPYVLVAHAFGSYNLRTFADRYMREVGGIVLVDADDEDVMPPKLRIIANGGYKGIVAGMQRCRNAVAAGKPLPPLPAANGAPPGHCVGLFFRGLPEARFSSDLNAALIHQARTQVSLYDAAISEMQENPSDVTYLQQHVTSFGTRPVRVLTTWHFGRPPDTPASAHRDAVAFEHASAKAQGSWLRLSTNSRQIFDYDESKNYIQLDHPHVVLEAIREVLNRIRI
jgi:pimeloyl-ACP methyl ester carboxylesterase